MYIVTIAVTLPHHWRRKRWDDPGQNIEIKAQNREVWRSTVGGLKMFLDK